MGSRKELNPYQAMTERWLCCFISVMLFTLIWHGKGQDQQPLAERVIGKQFAYTVARGDSLTSIGARFGVDAGGSGESSKFVKTGSLKRLPTPSRLIVFRRNDQNRT